MKMTNNEKKVPNMAQKQTKHAQRTKALINRSCVELMQSKNFDDITVQDICEKAMITRATFYHYYEDKYHLVSCVLEENCEKLFVFAGFRDKTMMTKQVYHNVITKFLDYLKENKNSFQKFLSVGFNEKLRAMLMHKLIIILEEFLKADKENLKFNAPLDIVSIFIVGGLSQIFMYAIENNKTYDTSQVISWFDEIYEHFYKA